jgi:diaminohydroxyphosphoribosylaminopyrimidine deaminase/5-amino-6-(5-phosphoribosylamino)uracil reductase
MGLDALAEAPRFDLVETRPIGPDVLHRWLRRR